jgi:hypothetical protein
MISALIQATDAKKPAFSSAPGWGSLFLAALAGNVVLAIFAWFLVGTMTLLRVG